LLFASAQFMFARVYAAQAPLRPSRQALIDAAKKEGGHRYHRDLAGPVSQGVFGAFQGGYPFIEVKQTMMAGAVGFERLRAEFASGRGRRIL